MFTFMYYFKRNYKHINAYLLVFKATSFTLFQNNMQLLLLGSMPCTWKLWSKYLQIVQKGQS